MGNQLSSFATLVYFQVTQCPIHQIHYISQVKYGMHAFLDPAQTRALSQVFEKKSLGIGERSSLIIVSEVPLIRNI